MNAVARYQATLDDLLPDWPENLACPDWLAALAKRLWDAQASMEYFLQEPSNDGQSQIGEQFTADLLSDIRGGLEFWIGGLNEISRVIDRELVTLRERAEHCLAQWQLLFSAYPQTVWEVPF